MHSLAVCYAFYYIDKTTLSYAAIFGIKEPPPEGLGLHGSQYSLLSSSFYSEFESSPDDDRIVTEQPHVVRAGMAAQSVASDSKDSNVS